MNVRLRIAGRYQWPQEPVDSSRVPGSTPESASHRAVASRRRMIDRVRSGSCPCWQPDPDDVDSSWDMDEFCALALGQVPRQIRWRTRHRFRRLRNRGGSRRLPAIGRARQAVASTAEGGRSRARRRRDQFVSGPACASGRVLVIPDVTIPRPFAGMRLGDPPADTVCGG